MPIKNVRLILVLIAAIIAYGQMCIAGTWIDDFSDRTLRDWGHIENSDDYIVIVNNECFKFRGKNEDANFSLANWVLGEIQDFSMEVKFMFRHIERESFWQIMHVAQNEKTGELEGLVEFTFHFDSIPRIPEPGTAFVHIYSSVPEEHPQHGVIWRPVSIAHARFAYEKEVWYTLKIEVDGNQYTFSIDDLILKGEDDSVPIGRIGFGFHGRLSMWLEDFIVTGPNVPDGGPGSLPDESPGGLPTVTPADKLTTTWGKLKTRD